MDREEESTGAVAGEAGSGEGGVRWPLAGLIVAELTRRRRTLAVAESLTGGLLGAAVTSVPGASAVFRGGVIAYATDVKTVLLGVPSVLLESRGAVDRDVAAAMAEGVRERLGADLGVSTTGVAGPDPADGHPPGAVFIAVSSARRKRARGLALTGGREEIRRATVAEALRLAWSLIGEERE